MLQSPQFLYRAEPLPQGASPGTLIPVEPYAMASRLSYLLWESGPDDALLQAASEDGLRTEAEVRAQAERMLADPRAQRVLWDFTRQWLGLTGALTELGGQGQRSDRARSPPGRRDA